MGSDDTERDATRLIALSDGVFAIAITLLVLNVDLPTDTAATVTWAMVGREWRDVFSYVVSFLVIGNFWTDHRRVFEHISLHTRDVTRINLLFLMTVAFLPFPTSLLGDYGGAVPTALYAASMATTGLILCWLWWYVSRDEALLVSDLDPRLVRFDRLQFLLTPLVFGLSIPVALYVDVGLALACWASLFVMLPLLKWYLDVEDAL